MAIDDSKTDAESVEDTGGAGARVLSLEHNRGVSFLQDNDYRFAEDRTKVIVSIDEARRLAGTMPLLFQCVDGDWRLIGAMGFRGTGNCLLGPQGGWWGTYIPERLRFYPLWVTPDSSQFEEPLLTVTAESPRVGFGGGKLLISEEGEQTTFYKRCLGRLLKHRDSAAQVNIAAQKLFAAGLLDALGEQNLLAPADGNWYIAEMRTAGELDAAVLADLAESGALQLAYTAYVSYPMVERLRQLAHSPQRRKDSAGQGPVAGLALRSDDDMAFNFDDL